MVINEGGNVVPNAKPVTRQNASVVAKNLQSLMPKGIKVHPIGSAGQKEVSSDMDVLIDAGQLMAAFPSKELKLSRKALEDYFKSKGLFAARTGVSVHVGVPTGDSDDVAQVDIMAVENAAAVVPLHTHDYSGDPKMKGGTLHAIWADLANLSSIPGHESLMMSPYKGLMDRQTKELISSDKDAIAKVIIGPTATARDMGSVQSILAALKRYPDKYRAVADKYNPQMSESQQFRKLMDLLK